MAKKNASKHKCFYKFKADSNFELGYKMGKVFKDDVIAGLKRVAEDKNWAGKVELAKEYLRFTADEFPQYVDEIKGYARGAEVPFEQLWPLVIGSELTDETIEKCTAVVTNNGTLIGSTEDFDKSVKDDIYIVQKTIRGLTTLELYYSYSLGGESVSINSHGFVQLTNSLSHNKRQVAIPKNVICRLLSETADPQTNIKKLEELQRSGGYSHTLVSQKSPNWNIEMTEKDIEAKEIGNPFVHTNHYLSELKKYQSDNYAKEGVGIGTQERYKTASNIAKDQMSVEEMKNLLNDTSTGSKKSIFNERTIARIVIDLEAKKAQIWMLREEEKGWVEYELDFI